MQVNTGNIIIVGGGAAGLMAALELLRKGQVVTVLEASDRLGGRVHTIRNRGFEQPVEKGSEFIHGILPLTMQLIKEAGIEYKAVRGKMVRVENGKWIEQDEFAVGWQELMEKMNEIEEDMTMTAFLQQYFSGDKYEALRKTAIRFAEGFDLADPAKASVLALRAEWMEESDEQYRVPGGFDQVIDWLEKQCRKAGGVIHVSSPVEKIKWGQDGAAVVTSDGREFIGRKAIVTVSLGLLQTDPPSISFEPAIPHYIEAAKKIGLGSVVKILLQFKESFWEEKKSHLGFILSEEKIPAWWTQLPGDHCLLTGWVGGPRAKEFEKAGDEIILQLALQSLSAIFEKPVAELERLLTASVVANWHKDPLTKGGYSYDTLESNLARQLLSTPINDTLFFAGEALYEGASPGTVEAALVSGKMVAGKIIPGV